MIYIFVIDSTIFIAETNIAMEEVFSIMEQHFGLTVAAAVFLVLAILAGIAYLAWKAGEIRAKLTTYDANKCVNHDARLLARETQHNDLQSSYNRTREEFDGHMIKHEDFASSVAELRSAVDAMRRLTDLLFTNKITSEFTKSQSPVTISPEGDQIIKSLGLHEMIDKKWADLSHLITEKAGTASPYDIQQFCITQSMLYPELFLCEEDLIRIKEEAYHTGRTINPYMNLIGVMVRDKYFIEHHINIADIDKHDPTKKC